MILLPNDRLSISCILCAVSVQGICAFISGCQKSILNWMMNIYWNFRSLVIETELHTHMTLLWLLANQQHNSTIIIT